MDKAKEYAGEIMTGISNFGRDMINDFGLNDEIAAITGTVTGAYNTAAGYVNSFADITRGAVANIDEFADRTGNWVTGDGFNTDKEVVDIKVARYKELLNNPVMMASTGGSSAGLEAEAMAWEQAEARTAEMDQLAKDLGISPEMNLKLQQQVITGNIAQNLNQEIAETWKTSSAKDVNALLKELAKVDPEAAKQWNGYFKGVRDTEAAIAYQKQLDVNSSLRQAELGTHAEANAIYAQQNISYKTYGLGIGSVYTAPFFLSLSAGLEGGIMFEVDENNHNMLKEVIADSYAAIPGIGPIARNLVKDLMNSNDSMAYFTGNLTTMTFLRDQVSATLPGGFNVFGNKSILSFKNNYGKWYK